uniref:Uncharacterized protein n=1 Tax=Lepeophtheirus salmonis TaxID=72036 RepID=A0A0K2T941_LEPSM
MSSYCYHFKLRLPSPAPGDKTVRFKIQVPFKCKRFTPNKFGYSNMNGKTNFLSKALGFLKHKRYESF